MKPFFSFLGGKWRLAPRYPSPTDAIVEPFAGSAGYSVRHNAPAVHLIEKDEAVFSVWDYLIHVTEDEIRSLPDFAEGQTTDDLDVPPEARDLIGFWISGGVSSPRKRPSKWVRDDIGGPWWGPKIRERIASQLCEIRHWTIRFGDYSEAPEIPGATYFVDPPYVEKGTQYRHGSNEIDFETLGNFCRSLPGPTIVCENVGAIWLPFREFVNAKSQRTKRSREAIWTSES